MITEYLTIPQMVSTLNSITELHPNIPTAMDIETEKLYINFSMLQVYNPTYKKDTVYYCRVANDEDKEELKDSIKNAYGLWVNPSYDFGTLGYAQDRFEDVQQLARLAYPKLTATKDKFKLNNLYSKILNIDPYKAFGISKKTMQSKGFSRVDEWSADQVTYACLDVFYLHKLLNDAKVKKELKNVSYSIDKKALKTTIHFQQNGILFHIPSIEKELTLVEPKIENNKVILEEVNPNSYQQVRQKVSYPNSDELALLRLVAFEIDKFFDDDTIKAIDVTRGAMKKIVTIYKNLDKESSTYADDFKEEVSNYLDSKPAYQLIFDKRTITKESIRVANCPIVGKSKSKYDAHINDFVLDTAKKKGLCYTPNEDEKNLSSKISKSVLDLRRELKRRTFLEQYKSNPIGNGEFSKMVTFFNPYGAVTGRTTSSGGDVPNGINAQQITRDLQYLTYKDTEDTLVIHADYSTAELRLASAIMGIQKMRNYLIKGIDLHRVSATYALGGNPADIDKKDRQKGKAISFGKIFGMGDKTFKEQSYKDYGVLFTDSEIRKINKRYFGDFKESKTFHEFWFNNFKKEVAVSPSGRTTLGITPNASINFGTQSSVADITKIASSKMVAEDSRCLDYLFSVVHDAIYMRVPKKEVHKYRKLLAKHMIGAYHSYVDYFHKQGTLHFNDIPQPIEIEYTLDGKYFCDEVELKTLGKYCS